MLMALAANWATGWPPKHDAVKLDGGLLVTWERSAHAQPCIKCCYKCESGLDMGADMAAVRRCRMCGTALARQRNGWSILVGWVVLYKPKLCACPVWGFGGRPLVLRVNKNLPSCGTSVLALACLCADYCAASKVCKLCVS